MATYFPYSHIIQSLRDTIQQTISRHAYFGEWSICEQDNKENSSSSVTISELYY